MPRPQFKPKHPRAEPDEIRTRRLAASLSMAQAATLCQVSAGSWEDWEYGRHPMPAPVWKLFRLLTAPRPDGCDACPLDAGP